MTAVAQAPEHDELVATMTGAMVRPSAPFAGSERLRADGRPRPALRAELREVDDLRNLVTCIVALAAPIAAIVVAGLIGQWWAIAAAIPMIGTLQLRMFVIHHEAAHRLLFSNRRMNDIIGINLMGWLAFGTGSHAYRRIHQAHHRDEFGPAEPDFLLYALYPIVPKSFARKLRRDALGVSASRIFKRRLVGLLEPGKRSAGVRMLAVQALLLGVALVLGHGWLYLWLWAVPYMSWYQVINRLRAVAEHGGMTRSADRRETTHIVRPNFVARIFLTPLNVAYHLPHHVDSGIPFRNLPRLQDILIEDGYVADHIVWPNYRSLWRAAASKPTTT